MKKLRKVLHLVSSSGYFGAENVITQLIRASESLEIEVILGVFGNKHNRNIEITKRLGSAARIVIFECGGRVDFKTIHKIRKFIVDNCVDILHTHGYKSNIYGYFATLFLNTIKVATCHNWSVHTAKMKLYSKIDAIFLRSFDKVACVSADVMGVLLDAGIKKQKVCFIENGIDTSVFKGEFVRPEIKKSIGIAPDENVIGSVGRLSQEKGHEDLLDSFNAVVQKIPNIKLLIVGDGVLLGKLKSKAVELGIAGKVIFTGFRNDIPQLLSIMDVFVLPSLDEGMPVALLEAMAARKTIIASGVGSVPKLIEHNISGYLLKPGDRDGLGALIRDALDDKKKSAFLAENAYNRVNNEYSAANMARKYEQLYGK